MSMSGAGIAVVESDPELACVAAKHGKPLSLKQFGVRLCVGQCGQIDSREQQRAPAAIGALESHARVIPFRVGG